MTTDTRTAENTTGIRRFIPILSWLPRYDRAWLTVDVIAGLTLWGLVVPEAMAYAGIAGLPPQAGLYTLLAALLVYALAGHVAPSGGAGHLGHGGAPRFVGGGGAGGYGRGERFRSGDLSGLCVGLRAGHRPGLSGRRAWRGWASSRSSCPSR